MVARVHGREEKPSTNPYILVILQYIPYSLVTSHTKSSSPVVAGVQLVFQVSILSGKLLHRRRRRSHSTQDSGCREGASKKQPN